MTSVQRMACWRKLSPYTYILAMTLFCQYTHQVIWYDILARQETPYLGVELAKEWHEAVSALCDEMPNEVNRNTYGGYRDE